jgi:hypothetical protein
MAVLAKVSKSICSIGDPLAEVSEALLIHPKLEGHSKYLPTLYERH